MLVHCEPTTKPGARQNQTFPPIMGVDQTQIHSAKTHTHIEREVKSMKIIKTVEKSFWEAS